MAKQKTKERERFFYSVRKNQDAKINRAHLISLFISYVVIGIIVFISYHD